MKNRFLFHLPNDIQQLMRLAEQIRELEEYQLLTAKTRYVLDLALEEMATNIIKYGYDAPGERAIEVDINFAETEVVLTLRDDGHEFNPLECNEHAVKCLEEREIGGVGIYLIRNMVRGMKYTRAGECNELVIHIGRE